MKNFRGILTFFHNQYNQRDEKTNLLNQNFRLSDESF